jgi:hypothetical protein
LLAAECLGRYRPEVERGVSTEDCCLELPQLTARFETQLLGEGSSKLPVRLERLCLPPGAVQREHELAPHAFAQRIRGDDRTGFGNDVLGAAEPEAGFEPLLDGGEAKFLEPVRLRLEGAQWRETVERPPSPEAERLLQRIACRVGIVVGEGASAGLEQVVEAVGVGLAGLEVEDVSRAAGRDRGLAQGPSKLPDVVLDDLGRARRSLFFPERVYEPLGRDRRVGMQQQQREHGALLRRAQRDRPPALDCLHGAEEPILHPAPIDGTRGRPARTGRAPSA